MPLTATTPVKRFSDPIEDYSPTILERVTAAPFNILNAPSNAVKSIIRAVKDQSLSDAANAVQSLIPFAGSEEVPASDITGSDDFLTNLAFDVFTDPTMLVGGIGSLTKTGKAAALVAERAAAVKVAEKLGTAEKLMEAKSALTAAESALKIAKLAKPSEPARSLVRFAGKDIGNLETAKKLAGKLNPMPDVRRGAYIEELQKVGRDLRKAGNTPIEILPRYIHTKHMGTNYYLTVREESKSGGKAVWVDYLSKEPPQNVDIVDMDIGKLKEILDKKTIGFSPEDIAHSKAQRSRRMISPEFEKARVQLFEYLTGKEATHIADQLYPRMKMFRIEGSPSKAEELLLTKQSKLKEELAGSHKGIIPIAAADKIRSTARTAAALFKHKGNDELLETAKDFTLSNAARDNKLLKTEAAHLINEIDILAKEQGISAVAMQERLTQSAEFRKTLAGNAPDIEKLVLEKSDVAYKKYQSDLVKASKIRRSDAKVSTQSEDVIGKYVFHGGDPNIESKGFSTGVKPAYDDAVWVTNDPEVARRYAEKNSGKIYAIDKSTIKWEQDIPNRDIFGGGDDAEIASSELQGAKIISIPADTTDIKQFLTGKSPSSSTIIERQAKAFQSFKAAVNQAKLEGEEARIAQAGFLQTMTAAPYTVGEINTIDKLLKMYEGLPELETANLIISTDLKSAKGMVEYTRRLVTPEAKKLRDKNPSLFSLIHSEFGSRLGAAKQRKLYPEKDILTINKLIKEDYGIKFDFFDTNIVKAMMDRRMQSYINIGRSQYIQFALDNMAVKGLNKKTGYTAGWFARRLNGTDKVKGGMYDVAAFKKKYKGLRVPKDMASEILGVDQILKNSIFNNNVGVGRVMKVVDQINAPFRIALTTLFLGYHHRNKVGNVINSWIGGINPVRQIKYELQAGKLLKAVHTGKATPEQLKLMDRLVESRILEGGISNETAELFKRFGIKEESRIGKLLNKPVSTITHIGRGKQFDLGTGRAYGKYIEDTSRIAHWLAKKADGATDLEAMRSVNKYLFDFTKLTDFEKKFARPTVLFYSWMRNNIPLQLRTMIDNPRMLEGYNLLTGQNDDEVPQYLRGSSSFKSPFGGNEVIGSLGFPQEDLNIGNVAAADPGGFQQLSALSDNFITRLSPAFRIPIELAMGRTTYGRKQLQDLTPAQKLKEFTPLSRFVTTGKKVTDPETDLPFKMLDILTGVRTYAYDPDRVRIDKMKRALLKSGKFQRSGFLVLPKEQYKEDTEVKKAGAKLQKAIRKLGDKKK